jgi:hypothetical protein
MHRLVQIALTKQQKKQKRGYNSHLHFISNALYDRACLCDAVCLKRERERERERSRGPVIAKLREKCAQIYLI